MDPAIKHVTIANLLPQPAHVAPAPGDYSLSRRSVIRCNTANDGSRVGRLTEILQAEAGIRLPVEETEAGVEGYVLCVQDRGSQRPILPLDAGQAGALGEEGYLLDADSGGVTIRAATPRGLWWGAMTLRQLMIRDACQAMVCGVTIRDRPRYAWRGFQIDSGRAPNSLPKIKRIIRIGALFKLNFFIFREGDDELNSVRYQSNKLGSENPYAFSLEELGALSQYARDYGIALVPEVESLGHSTAKGRHYPELVSGGFKTAYQGIGSHIRKSHLAPCDPRTLDLLGSIYSDLFSVLRPPLIHLGMDEVHLAAGIQADHLARLLPLVFRIEQERGVAARPIVWSDAPETPEAYKDRVIRCLWSYGEEGEIGLDHPPLRKQGIEVLSRPGAREHVFMAGGSSAGHTPYTKGGYEGAFHNLAAWAIWGQPRPNFIGLFAVQWSGNMTDAWLPDFLAAADFGWHPPGRIPDFEIERARIRHHLSRVPDASHPLPAEVDRPAWDGIWLKGKEWDQEILTNR